jgi:Mor family transcriptional regulator
VEGARYVITFTDANIDSVQCDIYAYVAEQLEEVNSEGTQIDKINGQTFYVANNNVNPSTIKELRIYAVCDGVLYNFSIDVYNLNG